MTKYPNRLWVITLALGCFFDFLFWGKPVGINFAIFTSMCIIGGEYLLLINNKKPAIKSLWLVVPLLFFTIMTFSRQEPLTLFLAYIFTLFLMGVFAITYVGGQWTQYSLSDYCYKSLQLLGSAIELPTSFFTQMRKEQAERGEIKKRLPVLPILRGLLIALPVVAIFASLLASADLVFSQKISDFFGIFDSGKISEYAIQFFIIMFWAYTLAGIFLHAASKSQDENLLGEKASGIKPFIGFTESTIVLGSVSILFLFFVIVQFQYFFGGNLNIGVEGYTYSQYARRGFNELVIVALFSLIMILGLNTVTKRESNIQSRIYSGLSIAIVAFVLIILVSAYQRLALAIDWHGFSRLRLYPQVFLIWVGILFLAVVILEALHQERYFAFAAILTSIGFAISLSLFNVDDAIVRHNILRASQGKHFNPSYLATLSPDAVPALAEEFSNSSLSTSIHEGIGAALLCHLNSKTISNTSNDDWRSFNLSQWNAKKALDSVKVPLENYRVNKDKTRVRVRTPGNILYECIDTEPNTRE